MFEVATGINSGADSYSVGVAATSDALNKIKAVNESYTPNVALVFSSVKYNNEHVLKGARSVIGDDVKIVGASTAGEITAEGPSKRESVAVMLLCSDTVTFASSVAEGIDADSEAAGAALAEDIKTRLADPKLVMMMADGLKGNGSAIIRGILSVFGSEFPVVGGSAGDDGKFKTTQQYYGDEVFSDAVAGLALGGAVNFSVGVNHGWNPVGRPRVVTEAVGTKIVSVDNEKAVTLYEEYLGEEEVENLKTQTLGEIALSYPLGIRADETSDEMLLRAPFAVGEDGSIVCGGEVPEGSEVQLMVGTKEDAVAAAKKAAEIANAGLGAPPKAAIIFSCHVRNTLFGNSEAASAEVEAIRGVIGAEVPLIGFYTYAEQAPVSGVSLNMHKCNPEFHNETVVLVLLSETES